MEQRFGKKIGAEHVWLRLLKAVEFLSLRHARTCLSGVVQPRAFLSLLGKLTRERSLAKHYAKYWKIKATVSIRLDFS